MLVKSVVLTALLSLIVIPSPQVDSNAFPSILMIRGGELKDTIVIHHKVDVSFEADPIVRIWTAIMGGERGIKIPSDAVEYDVGVFWGSHWVRAYGSDPRPVPGLQFSSASYISKMYVTANRVYWIKGEAPSDIGVLPLTGISLNPEILTVFYEAGFPGKPR